VPYLDRQRWRMATRGAHCTEQLEAPEDALAECGRAVGGRGLVLPLPADTPDEPRRRRRGESALEELIDPAFLRRLVGSAWATASARWRTSAALRSPLPISGQMASYSTCRWFPSYLRASVQLENLSRSACVRGSFTERCRSGIILLNTTVQVARPVADGPGGKT
jgi:hypothetical protein